MGHKLAADRYGTPEPPLPLPDLDEAIIQADALRVDWPEVDVVIGNPPFNGSQHLRRDLGEDYLAWLERAFCVGIRDFCTYWFRRAADHLGPDARAGLVGTNFVAQGRGREASLDYVVERGGVITDAVPSQKWPGEANVHVSIVNWVQRPTVPPGEFRLSRVSVPGGIAADLVPAALSTIGAKSLVANEGVAFKGPTPGNAGFLLDAAEARTLLSRTEAQYGEVVRRYLSGSDIADDPQQASRRWVIDFALFPLEKAARWPAALEIVRQRVKPERAHNRREAYRRSWWRFVEPRPGMRAALDGFTRFLAVNEVGKRSLFVWCEPDWCPNNKTFALALDQDYHFGVLASSVHRLWGQYRGSTLKADRAYTPTTVFNTFPWPDPDDRVCERVAAAARRVVDERASACAGERGSPPSTTSSTRAASLTSRRRTGNSTRPWRRRTAGRRGSPAIPTRSSPA